VVEVVDVIVVDVLDVEVVDVELVVIVDSSVEISANVLSVKLVIVKDSDGCVIKVTVAAAV
jgi:hypothetical protein